MRVRGDGDSQGSRFTAVLNSFFSTHRPRSKSSLTSLTQLALEMASAVVATTGDRGAAPAGRQMKRRLSDRARKLLMASLSFDDVEPADEDGK